jgi:hypothetical protein
MKEQIFIDASPNFKGKYYLNAFCGLFNEKYADKIQFVKAPVDIKSQPAYAVFILSEVNDLSSFSKNLKKEYEWLRNKIGDSKIFFLAPVSYELPDSITTNRIIRYNDNDENLSEEDQNGESLLARLIIANSASCVSDEIYNRRCNGIDSPEKFEEAFMNTDRSGVVNITITADQVQVDGSHNTMTKIVSTTTNTAASIRKKLKERGVSEQQIKEIEPQIAEITAECDKETVNRGKLQAIISGVGTTIRDICTQVISQIITNKIGG